MAGPPNLIFCMCDQLRWCELACYGHPSIRTPHIDRLAERGVRFEVAVSNYPVCMPARSMVVSGQSARTSCGRAGNTSWRVDGGGWVMPQWPMPGRRVMPEQTVPERLREAGYTTAAIGKWHIDAWPDAVGFDHYLIPAVQHAHSAQWFCEDGEPPFAAPGYSVDYEADRVARYLATHRGQDQPFYLYYNISPPHMPLADAPERYLHLYGRDDVVVRDNVDLGSPLPDQTDKFLTYLWDYRHYRDRLPHTRELPHPAFDLIDLTAMYMGLTTWVDDTVGRLVDAVEANGLTDDTVVVFTSDHGDNLGSHGQMGKAQLLEESYRVPMCVAGPGIAGGRVSPQVASLADWAPTFANLSGAGVPDHWHGQDLGPVLRRQRDTLDRNAAFIETADQGCAIRTPTHLLALPWQDSTDPPALGPSPSRFYDLDQDPFQQHNLADAEKNATDEALSTALAEQVRAWDRETAWGEPLELLPPGVK